MSKKNKKEPQETIPADVDGIYRLYGNKVYQMEAFAELAKIFHGEAYTEFLNNETLAKYFINGLFNENENEKQVNEAILNTKTYQNYYIKQVELGDYPLNEINNPDSFVLECYKNYELWKI